MDLYFNCKRTCISSKISVFLLRMSMSVFCCSGVNSVSNYLHVLIWHPKRWICWCVYTYRVFEKCWTNWV